MADLNRTATVEHTASSERNRGRLWRWWQTQAAGLITLSRLLWAAAVPILAWLFGLFFLTVPPQTADLLTQSNLWQLLLFHVGVAVWGFTNWFWAKWSIKLQPLYWPELNEDGTMTWQSRFLRRWLPLIPPLTTPFIALAPLWRTNDQGVSGLFTTWGVWFSFNVAILAFLFIAIWFSILAERVEALRQRAEAKPLSAEADGGTISLDTCLGNLPFARWTLWLWIGLFVILCVCSAVWPVSFPTTVVGAAGITLFGLSATTGLVTLASVLLRRCLQVPGLFTVGALTVGVAQCNNNHAIRTVEHASVLVDQSPSTEATSLHRSVANRPSLPSVLDDWVAACGRDEHEPRFVVVATAGGASRAALWTASVLHAIEAEPDIGAQTFRKALFAISGVSGGSLGAATYVAGLPPDGCARAETEAEGAERWDRTRGMLSENFLAPPIAAYLTTDLLGRFIGVNLPDRAAALEQAWEAAWSRYWPASPDQSGESGSSKQALPHASDFHLSFLGLWMGQADHWMGAKLPLLLLNGTHADTGLPILTSPVKVTQDQFPLALDLLNIIDADIRLSTAVTNSARFPVVSPGGTLLASTGSRDYGGAVMDGGYVENFGADTARDLVRAIDAWSKKRSQAAMAKRTWTERALDAWRSVLQPGTGPATGVQPHVMVIQISSDPSVNVRLLPRCGQRSPTVLPLASIKEPPQALADLLGPLTTVIEARGSRGARTAGDLMREKCPGFADQDDGPIEYVHFALCDQPIPGHGSANDAVGLNWALTDTAIRYLAPANLKDRVATSAMHACNNGIELDRLRKWFELPVKSTRSPAPPEYPNP